HAAVARAGEAGRGNRPRYDVHRRRYGRGRPLRGLQELGLLLRLRLGAELATAIVERSPEIPGSDAGIGRPLRADPENVLRPHLAPAIGALDGVLNAEIEIRKNIRPAEL